MPPYRDPQMRRASVREAVARHRVTRGGDKPPRKPLLPALITLRLETAKDIAGVLRGQTEAVLNDASVTTVEKARCVALLCSGLLRVFEQADVIQRLEALEKRAEEMRAQ